MRFLVIGGHKAGAVVFYDDLAAGIRLPGPYGDVQWGVLRVPIVQASMDTYKLHDRNIHPNNFWHTWHTAVYDLVNKTLRLNIQEDYAKHYDFKLN